MREGGLGLGGGGTQSGCELEAAAAVLQMAARLAAFQAAPPCALLFCTTITITAVAVWCDGRSLGRPHDLPHCQPISHAVLCGRRPFAPFKEQGSWRGCVACWTGEEAARKLQGS